MPPTSEFFAGSQIDGAQFKSRPRKFMNYLFQFNQLSLSARSIPGHEWTEICLQFSTVLRVFELRHSLSRGRMGKGKLLTGILSFLLLAFSLATAHAAEFKTNWQADWEQTVQGAKKEGKLSLYLYQGEGELGAVAQTFQKKYPEISVTTVTGRGNQLGPKIMAERRAGKFLADAYIAGLTSTYEILYRAKTLDPIRAALILPEVLDESKWWQGQHHYIDPENEYIFVFVGNVSQYISYHTKSVDPGEFRSYWDFLQPKWKGKILSRDPKISGSQRIGLRGFYYTPELGAEFVRRLYGEMDVTLTQEIRQATDWL